MNRGNDADDEKIFVLPTYDMKQVFLSEQVAEETIANGLAQNILSEAHVTKKARRNVISSCHELKKVVDVDKLPSVRMCSQCNREG